MPVVFSPTYDPEFDPTPSLGARLEALNAGMNEAVAAVNIRLDGLSQRLVGSEAAHAALRADALAALTGTVGQA